MTDIRIVPGTVELAHQLVPLLRAGDIAEGQALGFTDVGKAVVDSVRLSEASQAVFFDGELAFIFGVTGERRPLLDTSSRAQAWLLSGQACSRYRKAFLRSTRYVVDKLLEDWEELYNVIDARHSAALRWARWLGFEVLPPRPFGPLGMQFCPFVARRH